MFKRHPKKVSFYNIVTCILVSTTVNLTKISFIKKVDNWEKLKIREKLKIENRGKMRGKIKLGKNQNSREIENRGKN